MDGLQGEPSRCYPPYTVVAEGLAQPLDKSVDVASFRLDQPLMDRLIGKSHHERARVFMDAFFPGAVPSRGKYSRPPVLTSKP